MEVHYHSWNTNTIVDVKLKQKHKNAGQAALVERQPPVKGKFTSSFLMSGL